MLPAASSNFDGTWDERKCNMKPKDCSISQTKTYVSRRSHFHHIED